MGFPGVWTGLKYMEEIPNAPVHPITGETQRCFFADGFCFCNFIIRKSGRIVYRKAGGWLRFFIGLGQKEKRGTEKGGANSKNEKIPFASQAQGSNRL